LEVLEQCSKLVSISEKRMSYEDTRITARNSIVDFLTLGDSGFSGEQILYQKFEWTDTMKLQTTTWSGINILIWTNTTPVKKGNKFSVVAGRYDSHYWWSTEFHSSFSCNSNSPNPELACRRNISPKQLDSRSKVLHLTYDLLGSCVVLQLAKTSSFYQKQLKSALDSTSAMELLKFWNKSDPRSIQTGIFEERPILFILFDRESFGSLGSKLWYEHYNIEKHLREGNIRNLASIDFNDWHPSSSSIPDPSSYSGPTWRQICPSFIPPLDWFHELLNATED